MMSMRYLVSVFSFLCFRLSESYPLTSSPDDTSTTTANTVVDQDTLDIFLKAALIFSFFAVTLLCCVLKCRCFGPGDASGRSIWIPIFVDNPETDEESCRDANRNRSESQGYPFAPACPPPTIDAYISAMDGNAHPLDNRHLPPPPDYIDALRLPNRPRLNTKTVYDLPC